MRAGEGPFIDTLPLLINEVKIPPTIAANIPASKAFGGRFIAKATPIESGRATNETLNPARISFRQYCLICDKVVLMCLVVLLKVGQYSVII
jgi:hypothetical protein